MTRKRFDSAPQINVKDEGMLIQQVAGSTTNLLEVKAHNGATLMAVDYAGTMTSGASNTFTYLAATTSASLPANTTIGAVSPTELGYLDGVTSAIQTQLDSKLSTAVTSAVAGTGISVSAATGAVTFTNTGVTGLTGTANQITVSASTGSVTLSLPQSIATTSNVTFNNTTSARFIGTNNAHIDPVSASYDLYLNYYQQGRPIYVYGSLRMQRDATGYYQVSTSSWSGDAPSGQGKLEYHSNRWYFNTGGDSNAESWVFRRGGSNVVTIASDGMLYSYGLRGNANVAGTGQATYHPSGIYSTGTNWLYGAMHLNSNNINGGGTVYMSNWFRSQGGSGWYSESYGGGIWMTDSTWIRTYNGKNFYCDAEIRSNNPFSSNGPNNGIYVRLNSSNQGSFSWVSPNFWFIVDGSLVKTFVIDHPTKEDNWLVHACAEGPTSDVFYRGEASLDNGLAVVTLPDYFEELTELEGRTIQITPIADDNGNAANLAVYPITNGRFMVEATAGYINKNQKFYWRVDAIRKGTEFEVEPLRSTVDVHGSGPYTYLTKKV